jgi:SAM-dependent methyltransferase
MSSYRSRFVEVVRERGWTRGAELGLGSGALFASLLSEFPSLHLIGVDHFARPERMVKLLSIARDYPERCIVYRCKTADAAPFVPDGSLDFVFVDAGHKYGCVRSDLRAWWPKVRKGGWFGGHDYAIEYPGVTRAVNERFGGQVQPLGEALWAVHKC